MAVEEDSRHQEMRLYLHLRVIPFEHFNGDFSSDTCIAMLISYVEGLPAQYNILALFANPLS